METKLLFVACCLTGFVLGWVSRTLWQTNKEPKKSGGEKLLQKALEKRNSTNTDDEYKLVSFQLLEKYNTNFTNF
jgi:hypothetical protein